MNAQKTSCNGCSSVSSTEVGAVRSAANFRPLNSFHNSKDPMPEALVDKSMDWQKWRDLTGHDKASREVEVRAELIRGARPVIRLEVDRPLPAAIMEIAKTEGLPYELQITVTNAR